eukprot:2219492-Rhodomonas_salina.1
MAVAQGERKVSARVRDPRRESSKPRSVVCLVRGGRDRGRACGEKCQSQVLRVCGEVCGVF